MVEAIPGGRADHASTGRASGRTSAAARTSPSDQVVGKAFKLTKRGRRLLARRHRNARCSSASTARPWPREADLDAYLHRLEEAEKRDHRKLGRGHGPLPPAGRGAGHGLLAPQGLDALPRAGGLHPPPAGRRRLRRGEDAAAARPRRSGSSPATGSKFRENMFVVPDEIPGTDEDEPILSGKAT